MIDMPQFVLIFSTALLSAFPTYAAAQSDACKIVDVDYELTDDRRQDGPFSVSYVNFTIEASPRAEQRVINGFVTIYYTYISSMTGRLERGTESVPLYDIIPAGEYDLSLDVPVKVGFGNMHEVYDVRFASLSCSL